MGGKDGKQQGKGIQGLSNKRKEKNRLWADKRAGMDNAKGREKDMEREAKEDVEKHRAEGQVRKARRETGREKREKRGPQVKQNKKKHCKK
jgi:hypothetical protein